MDVSPLAHRAPATLNTGTIDGTTGSAEASVTPATHPKARDRRHDASPGNRHAGAVLGSRHSAGGAKNSNAIPSGSRKLSPEPYAASLMRPRSTPISSSRAAHFSSSA